MRNLGAVFWLLALLACAAACDSKDSSEADAPAGTHTVIVVDADSSLKRMAKKLHVHIESDGKQRLDENHDKDVFPQRYNVKPIGGDASRSFQLLAEALDGDDEVIASQTFKTGFVEGEIRYARIVLSKCSEPHMDEVEPSVLVKNESLAQGYSTACADMPAAGSGGSSGRAGAPMMQGGRGGKGGSGGMSGSGGSPKGGSGGSGGAGESAGAGGGGTGGSGGKPAEETCGDGHLASSEFCDTGIMAGKQGACPDKCETADHCNPGKLVGKDCQAHCEYIKITEAKNGDMCCPMGASPSTDDDCHPICGNSIVESGETCDPPSNCGADKLCGKAPACTNPVLMGEAEKCAVTCGFQPIQVCTSGDGCCPSGCARPADMDCPAACGDGTVDASETCEPSSTTRPCPKSCDDGNVCTTDVTIGSAATCNLACWHTPILTAVNGDGCCPANSNANSTNDNDCKAMCGNNLVEPGELCDGNCPSQCNDNDPCTKDSLTGSDCQRHCVFMAVTASQTADGCCPPGASSATDTDCGSTTNTNLLAGKVFESDRGPSTAEPGHLVGLMTDNDDRTRFISTPDSPITLTVDLGGTFTLGRIDIIWAGDTINKFTVSMSPDKNAWTEILNGKTLNQMIEPESYSTFTATPTGRYLQIKGVDRHNSEYGNSIYEVRAFAK